MHQMIVGMTLSGKTTLAKHLSEKMGESGRGVIVLDPVYGDWRAEYQTTDSEDFLIHAKKSRRKILVVDEGGDSLDKNETAYNWLATTSRHFGHNFLVICHRYTQISPVIRDQLGRCYVFSCGRKSVEMLAEEWNTENLGDIVRTLRVGEFVLLERLNDPKKMKIMLDRSGRVVNITTV